MRMNTAGRDLIKRSGYSLEEIENAKKLVKAYIYITLTNNQYSALISLYLGIGDEEFRNSNIRRLINRGEPLKAAKQFDQYCYQDGKKKKTLERQRKRESKLFLTPEIAGGTDATQVT